MRNINSNQSFVPFADQGMYLANIAGGPQAVIQLLWLYKRPVNYAGLNRFRDNLACGRLARLINPAILPFGRHQWVAAPPPLDAIIPTPPIDTSAFQSWADSQINLPMHPAKGPAWTFTVQSLKDGSTAISLVVSHCIADGMSTALAVSEAARGENCLPFSSTWVNQKWLTRIGAELHRTFADSRATFRALKALIRLFLKTRKKQKSLPVIKKICFEQNDIVNFPSAFVRVPISIWDKIAKERGTNRFTLLSALTVDFAAAIGRLRDNKVTLLVPINKREGVDDIGANRVQLAQMKINVEQTAGQLNRFQRQLRSDLLKNRREGDRLDELLPLVPFIPKRAFSAAIQLGFGADAELPITCSFIGEWPESVMEIDGTAADRLCFRGVDREASRKRMEARQGIASVPACVIPGYLILNFVAYQPGAVTQSYQLHPIVENLLSNLGIASDFFDR